MVHFGGLGLVGLGVEGVGAANRFAQKPYMPKQPSHELRTIACRPG